MSPPGAAAASPTRVHGSQQRDRQEATMSQVTAATQQAGRTVRRARGHARNARWVAWAGRVGHVAKGVSYALIAVLALQVALGDRARPGDRQGVLREVAGASFGTAALYALALGFVAYAFWQLVRAVLDRDGDGTDPKGLGKRAHHAGVGVIYLASAAAAVSLAVGSRSGAATGGDERAETAKVLDWPFGQWIVGAVGLGLVIYGAVNVVKAVTQSFRDDLREHEMSVTARPWAVRSGVLGHAARGVVFGLVGFFLAKAAWEYDPNEAVGIDGALAKLAHQSYGTWLLAAVALGLLAYAVFCLVQARYRRV
jgi:hypothetical protein